MSNFLLTKPELQDLTGAKLRRNVSAWLVSKGWAHEIGIDGWPRVSRAYAEAKLAGGAPGTTKTNSGPNFDALRRSAA